MFFRDRLFIIQGKDYSLRGGVDEDSIEMLTVVINKKSGKIGFKSKEW